MKSQQVVELAKRSLNDRAAWDQIMAAVKGSTDLDYLHAIVGSIPYDEDDSLGLATLGYTGDRMAHLFVPEVLAAETDRDQEILMGLTVKYFGNRIAAANLASALEKERGNSVSKKEAILLHIMAIALGIQSGVDFEIYLAYLDEED